jgi:thiamine monophosphate kinase
MIDVSDGLGLDAARLATASDEPLAARIESALVPRHVGVSIESAIADGEDHELLFCAAPEARVPESLPDGQGGSVPCTRIGTVVARLPSMPEATSVLAVHAGAALQDISRKGWMHD